MARGYTIDIATYLRLLAEGDLAVAEGTLAAFRLSSAQWSRRLAHEQAASVLELHAQVATTLAPGSCTPADIAVGNVRARMHALQRRALYKLLDLQPAKVRAAHPPEVLAFPLPTGVYTRIGPRESLKSARA